MDDDAYLRTIDSAPQSWAGLTAAMRRMPPEHLLRGWVALIGDQLLANETPEAANIMRALTIVRKAYAAQTEAPRRRTSRKWTDARLLEELHRLVPPHDPMPMRRLINSQARADRAAKLATEQQGFRVYFSHDQNSRGAMMIQRVQSCQPDRTAHATPKAAAHSPSRAGIAKSTRTSAIGLTFPTQTVPTNVQIAATASAAPRFCEPNRSVGSAGNRGAPAPQPRSITSPRPRTAGLTTS